MKRCTRCGETKDESDFHRRSASRDGLTYYCRLCRTASTMPGGKARRRALEVLAIRHEEEFNDLVERERGVLGLPPKYVRTKPDG